MSLHDIVRKKYWTIMPDKGYTDKYIPGRIFWYTYDNINGKVTYFREERDAWEHMDKLCDAAWDVAVTCIMVELRNMMRGKERI